MSPQPTGTRVPPRPRGPLGLLAAPVPAGPRPQLGSTAAIPVPDPGSCPRPGSAGSPSTARGGSGSRCGRESGWRDTVKQSLWRNRGQRRCLIPGGPSPSPGVDLRTHSPHTPPTRSRPRTAAGPGKTRGRSSASPPARSHRGTNQHPAIRQPPRIPPPTSHLFFWKIHWSRSVLPLPVPHRQGPEQLVKIKFYKFHSLSMHLRALLTFSSIPWPVIKPHICMLIFSPLTHLRKMFTVEKYTKKC